MLLDASFFCVFAFTEYPLCLSNMSEVKLSAGAAHLDPHARGRELQTTSPT
jgi:hypothetical protein